jgi:hypothetical protein
MNRLSSLAIVGAALFVSAVGLNAATQDRASRQDDLQLFAERVAAYAELHQRIDSVFPPWAPTSDMHLIEIRRAYLARKITAARQDARQGDVFGPPAALRAVIADALRDVDVALLLADLYEECEMPAGYRPLVNTPYPFWATHEVPLVLLASLPMLPAGIQYRLIDQDLLLWDVNADLIIDVLPDALPRAGS